jgi:hypothetical protein
VEGVKISLCYYCWINKFLMCCRKPCMVLMSSYLKVYWDFIMQKFWRWVCIDLHIYFVMLWDVEGLSFNTVWSMASLLCMTLASIGIFCDSSGAHDSDKRTALSWMAPVLPVQVHFNGIKDLLLQCHLSFKSLLYTDEQNAFLKDYGST